MSTAAQIGRSTGSDPLHPGARVGKYHCICRLAVGGMAELYLARAKGIEGFEKLVALKRILPQYANNEDFIRMFLEEARLAGTLSHQNIAQVYDIGQSGGAYFFTMEYVHGEDLRHLQKAAMATRGVPLPQALSIVIGVCAGLHYAHERRSADGRPLGIVHRDVSPSNVLVTYDGCAKVVDFGIAKATSKGAQTRSGTLKGKIAYMSPEQCKGQPLDRRSDIFAIGILLYELTTGRRLFIGENEFAILGQITGDDVPTPSTYKKGYPEDLERIVMRALARDKDQRYATAEELQLDLERFAVEQRLLVSPAALGQYMRELFGDKVDAWQAAQRQGQSLADHIAHAATSITHTDAGAAPPGDVDAHLDIDAPTSTRGGMGSGAPAAPSVAPPRADVGRRFPLGWVLVAAVIAGVIAAGGYFGVRAMRGGEEAEAAKAQAVEPAPAPPAPPAQASPAPSPSPVAEAPPSPATVAAETEAATGAEERPKRAIKKRKKKKAFDPDAPW